MENNSTDIEVETVRNLANNDQLEAEPMEFQKEPQEYKDKRDIRRRNKKFEKLRKKNNRKIFI